MNLNRRLKRLERRCLDLGQRRVPWFTETEGLQVEGKFLTWEEYERRFPVGPKPLRWADPENLPESNTTGAKP